MGNFPPTYDYPRVLTAKGDRLHPGTVLRLPTHHTFRAGMIWRVLAPVEGAYQHPLRLQCVTSPAVVLDMPKWFQGTDLELVLLSSFFRYEDFAGYYGAFLQLGFWLYAVEQRDAPFHTRVNAVHVTGLIQAKIEVSLWEIERWPNQQGEKYVLQYFYEMVKRELPNEIAKLGPVALAEPSLRWH